MFEVVSSFVPFLFWAKLLDPISGIVALVVGCMGKSRVMIVVGAVAGVIASEILTVVYQVTYGFPLPGLSNQLQGVIVLLGLVTGVFAMAVWAAVGNILVRRLFSRSEGA